MATARNLKSKFDFESFMLEMDALGNVMKMRQGLNNVRNFKSTNSFERLGVELPPTIEAESKLFYTGQERDGFTNYDYMHFRFYASSMGRFLKPDNIIPDITNPQNWNAYTYVKGNPVNYNDPSGHGPNVPSYPAYIPNTHSFGMSWFDQFDSGWLPWTGQTAENSWYFGGTRSALGYYHNQYLRSQGKAAAQSSGREIPKWVAGRLAVNAAAVLQRQQQVQLAINTIQALFAIFNIAEPLGAFIGWDVSYINVVNPTALGCTYTSEAPYRTEIFANIWVLEEQSGITYGGQGVSGGKLKEGQFTDFTECLWGLITHEYLHHAHPDWTEWHVMERTTIIFTTLFGWNPWE